MPAKVLSEIAISPLKNCTYLAPRCDVTPSIWNKRVLEGWQCLQRTSLVGSCGNLVGLVILKTGTPWGEHRRFGMKNKSLGSVGLALLCLRPGSRLRCCLRMTGRHLHSLQVFNNALSWGPETVIKRAMVTGPASISLDRIVVLWPCDVCDFTSS
jgi:hypothetical protein